MIWNKKYPRSSNPRTQVLITIGFGVFVALFLAVFQPFELSSPEVTNRYLKIMGYGFITSIVLVVYHQLVVPRLNERNWTLGKEIVATLLLILMIGICNYLYTWYIFDWPAIRFQSLIRFVLYTLAVGVFPVAILTVIKQNQLNRKYLEEAKTINATIHQEINKGSPPTSITLVGAYNDEITLNPEELLFVESIGN